MRPEWIVTRKFELSLWRRIDQVYKWRVFLESQQTTICCFHSSNVKAQMQLVSSIVRGRKVVYSIKMQWITRVNGLWFASLCPFETSFLFISRLSATLENFREQFILKSAFMNKCNGKIVQFIFQSKNAKRARSFTKLFLSLKRKIFCPSAKYSQM